MDHALGVYVHQAVHNLPAGLGFDPKKPAHQKKVLLYFISVIYIECLFLTENLRKNLNEPILPLILNLMVYNWKSKLVFFLKTELIKATI